MSEQETGLVWLRNDLRLHDHEPLTVALKNCKNAYLVYCLDPRHYRLTRHGWQKTGPFRTNFLLESLQDLRSHANELGMSLILRQGKPEDVLPALAQECGAAAVYGHKEATSEELHVEEAMERNLFRQGTRLKMFWGNTLYHIEDLPYPVKGLPDSFATFRKDLEKHSEIRPMQPEPVYAGTLSSVDEGRIPSLGELGFQESGRIEPDFSVRGGEFQALEHLHAYIWEKQLLPTFKETRHGLMGMDTSTKLSSWLSLGCISPRRVYQEVRQFENLHEANEGSACLAHELLWRDYFRFAAKKFGNKIFQKGGMRGKGPVIQADLPTFKKWASGQTGIPFIDACMRQLSAEGYLSHRGRQATASFLVYDLKQDWTLGSSWFEHLLTDYDPCSNWGNWNYSAGVGNESKPAKHASIVKQAKEFDPDGTFVRHWVPEVASLPAQLVHEPYKMTVTQQLDFGIKLNRDYPRPVVKLERSMN